jgi:hypothetical protein
LNGGVSLHPEIGRIRVDDAGWTATHKLLADMNTKYSRCDSTDGGVFPSKVTSTDWLIRLTNVAAAAEMEEYEEEDV